MVQGDVVQMAENGAGGFNKVADVVVTNPPFGTKSNEGIDMKFLEAAQDRFHEFSIFKGSSYKYVVLKSMSERDGSDIQRLRN